MRLDPLGGHQLGHRQALRLQAPVVLGNDNGCVEFSGAREPRLTDTNVTVTKTYLASDAGYLNLPAAP